MLPKLKNKAKMRLGEDRSKGKSRRPISPGVGLQILVKVSNEKSNNVVVKSGLKLDQTDPRSRNFCYLQWCRLCHKKLSSDKEVYMYKGDQGFCSVECRDRQIAMDETRELEISIKQMRSSYRHCKETRTLLQDLRWRKETSPSPECHRSHWIVF